MWQGARDYVIDLWNLMRRPAFWDDEEFAKSLKEAQEFPPQQDIDYTWVREYAIAEYGRMDDTVAHLEGKADNLIMYVGAFTIVLIAAAFSASRIQAVCLLPGMLAALLAVLIAMRVRWPVTEFGLPSTERAIAYAHYGEWDTQQAQGAFSSQIGAATVGQRIVSKHKVDLVRRAMHFFVAALVLLVIGIVAGLFLMEPEKAQPTRSAREACRLSQPASGWYRDAGRDSAMLASRRVVSAGLARSQAPVALWAEAPVSCRPRALTHLLSARRITGVFAAACEILFVIPSMVP